ncbi:MAG: ABC transporter ATP-binding protein [Dethiobacteria bacterium]|nr:ABC transporter ATP-binding protein [Dethiobacteria bacterium]
MKNITKRFGTLLANDGVDFDLRQGEIHALLGENGAGKTTLMRILYGLYRADDGEIFINEKPVNILSPKDAIRHGIGMVTQHFTLVPPLTVAENIVLGAVKGFTVNPKEIQQMVSDASEKYGIPVKPDALVRHLSVGERQRVEILKALYRNAKVLIMDEPTAVLVPQEVEVLFASLNRLVDKGLSVIFISHKLNEVMAICNRVTVLRSGKLAGTVDRQDTSEKDLAKMMVGRETFGIKRQSDKEAGEPIMTIDKLSLVDEQGIRRLKEITLELRRGEILSIAGVSGNGQSELVKVLTGLKKPTSGKVIMNECDITGACPAAITLAGMGRTPEDRHAGVVGELTVAENLALESLEDYTSRGVLDMRRIREHAQKLIEEYSIKATPEDKVRTLSGGNMQKVVMARSLSRKPSCVLATQPTRGLDVGATEYVRGKLLEERDRGAGVMLVSEDLEEVMELSDRIAVMYEGRIMGIIPASEASEEVLGLMMAGVKDDNSEKIS